MYYQSLLCYISLEGQAILKLLPLYVIDFNLYQIYIYFQNICRSFISFYIFMSKLLLYWLTIKDTGIFSLNILNLLLLQCVKNLFWHKKNLRLEIF